MANQRKSLRAFGTLALLIVIGFLLFLAFRNNRPAPISEVSPPVMTRAEREELGKFQGTWDFVALEVDGSPKPDADFKKYTVRFDGDQWLVSEGTNLAAQSTIVVDPTAYPKTIDVYPAPGKGLPIHGIYEFKGDTLTICDRGEDKGGRPTDFRTEPNSGLVLIVCRRAQD